MGIQLHCHNWKHGLIEHLFIWTNLISMYGECGCVGYARKVFDEMLEPNIVVWNAVTTASFRGKEMKEVRKIFDFILLRNLTSWNVILAGYVKMGELELEEKCF